MVPVALSVTPTLRCHLARCPEGDPIGALPESGFDSIAQRDRPQEHHLLSPSSLAYGR